MIKYVIHTPKGGVGKTTISTNLALMLADRGKRVWALDLAQGSTMSEILQENALFQGEDCKIETREGEELPTNFPGSQNYDFMVVDTDDYWKYLDNIFKQVSRGWRLIAPVPPEDQMALKRVPGDLKILTSAALLGGSRIPFKVLANKVTQYEQREQLKRLLEESGISSYLSEYAVPFLLGQPDCFYTDVEFSKALDGVLEELG